MTDVPQVYAAISAVMDHMSKEGIAKTRKNQQQGFSFRGIDDMYNALSSVLATNKLVMLPFVQDMVREERQTKSGGMLMYTILTVDFKMVSAVDGSNDVIRMIGEAMDSGDKSANKSQSAALKYAAMQVFMIPTEGNPDADSTTHEVVSNGPAPRTKLEGPHTSKTALMNAVKALTTEIGKAETPEAIDALLKGNATVKQAQRDWPELLDGDPNNVDIAGLKAYVRERREALAEPKDEMLELLLNTMKQSANLRAFTNWRAANEAFIDGLSDPDRRTLERESDAFESGLTVAANVAAG